MSQWHVIYTEHTDDNGNGPCGLSIGPYEDDAADTFAFSENFSASDGVPDEVQKRFELMAAAPAMLAELKELAQMLDNCEAWGLRNRAAELERFIENIEGKGG